MVVAVLLAACDGKKEQRAPAPAPVETKPAPAVDATPAAPIEVTGRQLYEDYAAGVAAADAKYLHKPLRVQAIVKGRGGKVLELMAPHQDHINAWFTDDTAAAMHQAKPYDEVFVRCTGDGMLDVPILKDCTMEPIERLAPDAGSGSERIVPPRH